MSKVFSLSNLSLIHACLGTNKHYALSTCCTLAQIMWMNGFVQRGTLMYISLQQTIYLHVI